MGSGGGSGSENGKGREGKVGGTITHQYNTAHTKHRTECASPQEASAIKPPGKPALRHDLSLIAPHVCEREGFLRQPSGDCLPIAQQMGDCLSFSTEVVLPLFSSLGGAVPAGVTRFPCARPRVEKSRGVVCPSTCGACTIALHCSCGKWCGARPPRRYAGQ